MIWINLIAQQQTVVSNTQVIGVVATAMITGLGSWFVYRGKTQDTANWLIKELRLDAEDARSKAANALARTEECEEHRTADQSLIKELTTRVEHLEIHFLAADE